MDWNDKEEVSERDRRGYNVLEALTIAGQAYDRARTYSAPKALVCIDGKTYWVKGQQVQQGLVAELIAGRLAAKVGAGPLARIIHVRQEVLPSDGSANHLLGVVVGSEDQPGTVNIRELASFMDKGEFRADMVDQQHRIRVAAFQTWLGVGDTQALINVTNGRVYSIDHGECFGSVQVAQRPTLVLAPIPGLAMDSGKDVASVADAMSRIESVSDEDLLNAITCMPLGDIWRSPVETRLAIGRWLADRRGQVREVMESWLHQ